LSLNKWFSAKLTKKQQVKNIESRTIRFDPAVELLEVGFKSYLCSMWDFQHTFPCRCIFISSVGIKISGPLAI